MAHSLHADHEEHGRALDEVERVFADALAKRTGSAGHRAYRMLARFAGQFLAHLEEEEAGQPRLWEMAGEARLAAGMAAFKSSRTPDQTRMGWASMLPAMNPGERGNAPINSSRDPARSTPAPMSRSNPRRD
jgi:hypothetical protein